MLALPITKEQLLFLIDQLSETEKQEVLQYLTESIHKNSDEDDTPDSVVLLGIKQGFREAFNGELIPLEQMWEGINAD